MRYDSCRSAYHHIATFRHYERDHRSQKLIGSLRANKDGFAEAMLPQETTCGRHPIHRSRPRNRLPSRRIALLLILMKPRPCSANHAPGRDV
jgi:hypothetical protein